MNALTHLAINEEGFAFNPHTGDSFHINGTGLNLLHQLRDGISSEEISKGLAKAHGIDEEEATRDVHDFLTSLKTLGLI